MGRYGKDFIYGSSLGSTTAPLVAEGKKIAGIVVQGGGGLTYLERMINFDRHYLERSGRYSPQQIHDEMIRRSAFHQLYLLGRRTPEHIALERPDLGRVGQTIRGGTGAPPHYGRPYACTGRPCRRIFLQRGRVEAPVLVFYAEFDQFEPLQSHQVIVDTVNRLRPGTAKFVILKGLDHSLRRYPDKFSAYREEEGELAREAMLAPMLAWLKESSGSDETRRKHPLMLDRVHALN